MARSNSKTDSYTVTYSPGSKCQVVLLKPDEGILKKGDALAMQRFLENLSVPGFRKGKVPEAVGRERITPEELRLRSIQLMSGELLMPVMMEKEIPVLEILNVKVDQLDPLQLSYELLVSPLVEMKPFDDIKVTAKLMQVEKDEMEKYLEMVRKVLGTREPVDRAVKEGDTVEVTLTALRPNGEAGESRKSTFEVEEGAISKELLQTLIGMKKGEKKSFAPIVPDAVKGEDPQLIEIELLQVVETTPHPLDDELAKKITGEKDATLESYQKKVLEGLENRQKNKYRDEVMEEYFSQLEKRTKVDLPPQYIEEQTQALLKRVEQRCANDGTTLPEYLSAQKLSEQQFMSQLKETARQQLVLQFSLGWIAKEQGISVSEEEISTAIADVLERTPAQERDQQKKRYKKGSGAYTALRHSLLIDKVTKKLIDPFLSS